MLHLVVEGLNAQKLIKNNCYTHIQYYEDRWHWCAVAMQNKSVEVTYHTVRVGGVHNTRPGSRYVMLASSRSHASHCRCGC